MKNLKKILALAIAFVMCFTMFAGALVFSDVPAGGDYSAAITLLSDLGVIAGKPDGSFGINDAISRADAACLIARLMTGEQNPPKYNNAPVFTDVVPGSYYESSVGYCAALGITSGTGNGQFSPSKTITDGEFVAMLTRALGYDTPEHPLQWPMGNIVVAQQKGLLKNVNIEYTSDALRGEDAQMLANALFADYDRWAAQENLYQRADDRMSPTIAEIVFNLGRMAYNADYQTSSNNVKAGYNRAVDFFGNEAKKVYNDGKTDYEVDFDCQAHTWVIAGVDAREKENTYVAFAISDDDNKVVDPLGKEIRSAGDNWAYQTFTYTGDITPFIGYQVELWGEMDHPGKTLEVAAIRTIEGQKSYDYNASMEGGNDDVTVDDTKLKLKDAETGYANLQINTKNNWQTSEDLATGKYKNNRDVAAVYNLWKGHEKKDRQHVNGDELLRIKDGDQFKLFDWDDDGDLDFVVKNTAKYAIVEDVTAKRVVVASIDEDGKGIGLKADKTADNTSVSLKLGESDLVVNADGVEEGDIVEITVDSRVYTKADDEVVTITLSKVEPDAHKLTRVSTKGTLAPFFDGEEFFVAEGGFWDLTEAKDPEDYQYEEEDIKRDFDLFLDRNGFIVYSRYSNGDSAKYMLIMETQDGGGRISAHHLPQIKALLENDKVETFDTIEKLKFYAPNGTTAVSDCYDASNYQFNQINVIGRVYKYYTNSKGEITKLVEAFDDTTPSDSGRNRTAILGDYSFNEKSISLKDEDSPSTGRYNFEKAKAVFVVKTPTGTDGNVATYIRKDKDSSVEGAYWYVDRADVIAVDPDDIPDIAKKSPADPNGPNAEVLTAATLSAVLDATAATSNPRYANDSKFNVYSSWQYSKATTTGANKAAYIGYTNDNRDVSAALIGVDDFEGFGRNSVKLGILKRVDSDASEKDDEYVYTFHLAVDGKEIAEYKSDSVEGLDDIMSLYSNGNTLAMSSKKDIDAILDTRGLAYVEVRFDGDLVDEIVVMSGNAGNDAKGNATGDMYIGEYYSVTRAVVGSNKLTGVVQFNDDPVTYSGEKTFNSVLNQSASAYHAGLTADTKYYAIDKRPTIKDDDKPYAGTTLMVTNDFEEDYDVTAAEKADINYSSIDNSNINDQYYVIDVATEKASSRANMSGKDAVAVVIFNKLMEENPVGGTGSDVTTPGGTTTTPVSGIPYGGVIPGSLSIRYGGASADRTITNNAPDDVEYAKLVDLGSDAAAVEVKFKPEARLGKYVVEGDTKKNGSFTVTITLVDVMPDPVSESVVVDNEKKTMGAVVFNLDEGKTPDDAADVTVPLKKVDGSVAQAKDVRVTVKDEAGKDVTSDFTVSSVATGITIAADTSVEAGKYTVTIKDTAGKTVDTFTVTYNAAIVQLQLTDVTTKGSVFEGKKALKVILKDAAEAEKVSVGDSVEVTVNTDVSASTVASIDGNVVTINLNKAAVTNDVIKVTFAATDKHLETKVESGIVVVAAPQPNFGISEDGDGIQVPSDAQSGIVGTPAEAATITGTRVENSSEDEVNVVVSGSFPNVSEENENDHFNGFSAPGETKGEKILLLLNLPSPNGESADFIIIPNGHKQSNGRFRDKYLTGAITDHGQIATAVGLEETDLYFGGTADGNNNDCLYLSYLIDRASGKGSVELIWVIDGVQIPVTYNIDASGMTMAAPAGA